MLHIHQWPILGTNHMGKCCPIVSCLDRPSKLRNFFNGDLPSNNTTQNRQTNPWHMQIWFQTIFAVHQWLHCTHQSSKVYCKNVQHGPACIAFLCSSPLPFFSGCMRPYIAKTWVLFQTTTYIRKITKFFDILLLLTCEPVLHAPTLQI